MKQLLERWERYLMEEKNSPLASCNRFIVNLYTNTDSTRLMELFNASPELRDLLKKILDSGRSPPTLTHDEYEENIARNPKILNALKVKGAFKS